MRAAQPAGQKKSSSMSGYDACRDGIAATTFTRPLPVSKNVRPSCTPRCPHTSGTMRSTCPMSPSCDAIHGGCAGKRQ